MNKILFICLAISVLFHVPIHTSDFSTIHVFGDSHSFEFSHIPSCVIHWLGPITMHRIGRDHLNFLHLPSQGVLEGQVVIFVFGEIDARCHIGKQRDIFNRSLEEVIHVLVHHYLHAIVMNRCLYHDLTCIVYSITPPIDLAYNPIYPFYGTLEDRIHITKKMNKKLADLCHVYHIPFLDVYDDYATSDGSLNVALSDGTVHIHPAFNQPIAQKLDEILSQLKTP